jgi:two-component system, NarL family, nitrate/nitrite response regulator NarL
MTNLAPIAVLLVDDQPATLWGLETLIGGEWPRMTVAGKACDRDAALGLAATLQPDVILLDLDLAGDLSLEFLPELLGRSPARVLIFTCLRDRALHERALRDGASGVVLKDESAKVLLEAITSVSSGVSRQSATHQTGRRVGEIAELP